MIKKILIVLMMIGLSVVCFANSATDVISNSDDGNNAATIGYGHKIKPEENFGQINEQQADALFKVDVANAEKLIKKYIKVNVTQTQFDALVSFAYSVTPQTFKNSKLVRDINNGDFESAAHDFAFYNNVDGEIQEKLILRRQHEARLYQYGDYGK